MQHALAHVRRQCPAPMSKQRFPDSYAVRRTESVTPVPPRCQAALQRSINQSIFQHDTNHNLPSLPCPIVEQLLGDLMPRELVEMAVPTTTPVPLFFSKMWPRPCLSPTPRDIHRFLPRSRSLAHNQSSVLARLFDARVKTFWEPSS